MIIECRMTTFKVVSVHIFTDCLPCFSDIVILGQICFLVLEASEPSFNHDIVSPPAFTIHALTDLVLFEEIHVLIACKLTALIRIQDNRFCHHKRLFLRSYDHSGIQSIIDFPANDTAAVPVNHSGQIQESTLNGDVCNVD